MTLYTLYLDTKPRCRDLQIDEAVAKLQKEFERGSAIATLVKQS